MTEIIKKINSHIEIKSKKEGKKILVSGWANYKKVDDVGDLIMPDAWDTSRFDQNPMMLFNHNWDYPIGKCTKLEIKEDGLWYEGELSDSEHEKIKYVKDLVAEGILKTSSVGYQEIEAQEQEIDGKRVKVITKAKLHEISIVSLPMNDASTITASAKGIVHMDNWNSYKDAAKDVLKAKGALVASEIHEAISELQADGTQKEELLNSIAERAQISREQLMLILAGEITPIPDPILEVIALKLGMSFPALQKLNQSDAELEPEKPVQSNEQQQEEEMNNQEQKPNAETENEKSEVEAQNAFQQCVSEKIPKLIAEGKEQDQAVAIAISMCSEQSKCAIQPTEKMMQTFCELAIKSKKEMQENIDTGNPHIELMKQTNVMLGAIASKFDSMLETLTAILDELKIKNAKETIDGEEPKIQQNEDMQVTEDEEKMLDEEVVAKLKATLDTLERAVKMMA